MEKEQAGLAQVQLIKNINLKKRRDMNVLV